MGSGRSGPGRSGFGAWLDGAGVHDRLGRGREVDPLFPVAAVQALDELVDDRVLRGDLGSTKAYVEVDGGAAEGVEPHRWLVGWDGALDCLHDLAAHLAGDPLDVLEVAVVADADLDGHRHLLLGQVVVGDDGGGDGCVRDDEEVVGQLADDRVAPVRVLDVSLHPVVELDEVARLDLARGEDVHAGEQVGQGVLQGERDRQAADAERGEQRRDGHAEAVEQDQRAEHPDRDSRDVHEDGG